MKQNNPTSNFQFSLDKIQHTLEWVKTQFYLDSIAEKAKSRIVRRGEVYQCNFGMGVGSEMQKDRPCLIVQGNVGNINSSNVIVAPITHTDKPIPTMAHIDPKKDEQGNLILDGQVNLSNIQTVSKARLGDFITKLSKNDMENVNIALYSSLGLMKEVKSYKNKIENLNKYIEKLTKKN